ncbi:PH domain-containing protein [Streptomyces sp. ACA25]|uniref:PH domain-containing protein n=1 Tax=Streptomyces sp. ACA25 TaxID=3022596 RepID=UPI00230743C4|nr:PH domain-containing protein [Streptomyces sp. ACA25]MDB1089750.1 PH domain-containing protein [Streptomyces sp. ACA25]
MTIDGLAEQEESAPAPGGAEETPWLRLDAKMIWVDALRVVLSLLPAVIAVLVIDGDPAPAALGSVGAIAAWGLVNSIADVLRWVKTRYRITDEYVERRTGLFVKTYRSVGRDRIRSVDADAKLLQRLAGLRRVRIGAGQANTAMESALVLDAVSREAADRLRRDLLGTGQAPAATVAAAGGAEEKDGPTEDATQVFARLRWWWVFYNMFSVWAYFMAAGLLWGAYWMTAMFGLDPGGWLSGLADWDSLGRGWTLALALVVTGLLGVIGLAGNFFTENAHFRLERVLGEHGTVLRTTQGLFKTREVNRDDNRLRGVTLSEPLLWRWMRMVDTTVITTGLSIWNMTSTILPRGPMSVARPVVASVLDEPDNPLDAPLRRHPRAALRRRLLWAGLITGAASGLLGWLGGTTPLPGNLWWITALVLYPLTLWLAWVAHRALGHTVAGNYLVIRSGAVNRATSVLRRQAVSGVEVRQSLLQRRLGLATVSVTTAAGHGLYRAPDVAAGEALDFAEAALPGYLEAFRLRD